MFIFVQKIMTFNEQSDLSEEPLTHSRVETDNTISWKAPLRHHCVYVCALFFQQFYVRIYLGILEGADSACGKRAAR